MHRHAVAEEVKFTRCAGFAEAYGDIGVHGRAELTSLRADGKRCPRVFPRHLGLADRPAVNKGAGPVHPHAVGLISSGHFVQTFGRCNLVPQTEVGQGFRRNLLDSGLQGEAAIEAASTSLRDGGYEASAGIGNMIASNQTGGFRWFGHRG